jgi:hypothetical protein
MTDQGPVRCFLGIEMEPDRSRRTLHIRLPRAVQKLLATYGFCPWMDTGPHSLWEVSSGLDPDIDTATDSADSAITAPDSRRPALTGPRTLQTANDDISP